MSPASKLTPYYDVYQRIDPGPQSMKGFDPDYENIVDYIIGCTYKIWEEKKIGLIASHYGDEAIVRTPGGEVVGVETVIANTVQALSLMPDRRLFPEDVVWTGNDVEGFLSSHRIMSTAHHQGYGIYGPPTGNRLTYRGIADCLVKENKVVEEWLVRDNLDIILQMDLDGVEFAKKLVSAMPDHYYDAVPDTRPAPAPPVKQQEGFDPEFFIKDTWHTVWNLRRFDQIKQAYISTIHCHSSGGRALFGHDDLIQFAIDWLACFPDAKLHFEHFCALGDEQSGYRTSLRWTLSGTHTGIGLYGDPSGKPVTIMGITQARIENGLIVEEWTVFDELNILCQLHIPEEDTSSEEKD